MKKTILISSLASASNHVDETVQEKAAIMFGGLKTNLAQCYDMLPENGELLEESCHQESDDSLKCKFKCESEEESLLLSPNIKFVGYDINCKCHQTIGGQNYSVPCNWSGLPKCGKRSAPNYPVRPEYGERCGTLSDRNGIWKCDSKSCYLDCNHGYMATDIAAKMSPKCSCSKFGDCSWFKPASCVKINHENGKCKLDEAPIGKFDCTGNSIGDLCLLQCPADYKPEQAGVRRCECDSTGACDWRGDKGHCREDFTFPGLEMIESSSLLSNQKCRDLPPSEIGFWTCDEHQTCSLECPPGYDTNRVVEIDCICSNGACLFQNRNSDDNRFQIHDIERTSEFECIPLLEEEIFEPDQGLDRCSDLPHVKNGLWSCTHGTCSLSCADDATGLHMDRLVIDCLQNHDIDWSHVNCSAPVRSSKGQRSHVNLDERNIRINF